MKCTFKGCETQGEPQEGFDFFMCERCGEEVEALIVSQVGRDGFAKIMEHFAPPESEQK